MKSMQALNLQVLTDDPCSLSNTEPRTRECPVICLPLRTFKAGLHFLTLLPIEHSTRSLPWTWAGNTAGAGSWDSQGLELCQGSLEVVPVSLGHVLWGCCHVSPAPQRPREEEKSPWASSPSTAEPCCTNPPGLLTAGEKETLPGEFSLFVKWAHA